MTSPLATPGSGSATTSIKNDSRHPLHIRLQILGRANHPFIVIGIHPDARRRLCLDQAETALPLFRFYIAGLADSKPVPRKGQAEREKQVRIEIPVPQHVRSLRHLQTIQPICDHPLAEWNIL